MPRQRRICVDMQVRGPRGHRHISLEVEISKFESWKPEWHCSASSGTQIFFIIFNHFLFNILIITAVKFFYRFDPFGRASGAGATNNAITSMHIAWQDLTHWTTFSTWKSLLCHSSWCDSIVLSYHPEWRGKTELLKNHNSSIRR
jgi:hypothetical protein